MYICTYVYPYITICLMKYFFHSFPLPPTESLPPSQGILGPPPDEELPVPPGVRDVQIDRPNMQTSFGFVLQSNTLRPGCMICESL